MQVKRTARKDVGMTLQDTCPQGYEAPALRVLGYVSDLTQGCDKKFGTADGFTFHGVTIVCTSGG
jgi:hypothetical protein